MPNGGPLDTANALKFRTLRYTPPCIGVPREWNPRRGLVGFRGPMKALAKRVPLIGGLVRTVGWKPGEKIDDRKMLPVSVEELVATATGNARKRLQQALTLDDKASICHN